MKSHNMLGQLILAPIVLLSLTSAPLSDGQRLHQNASKAERHQQSPAEHLLNVDSDRLSKQSDDLNVASFSDSMLRTYIRTNSMRAYHLDLHSYRPSKKYSGDPEFVNSKNAEHKSICARHLNNYHQLLKSFKDTDPIQAKNSVDSMKLADVFGRPEAGILQGNQFWLGAYDDCFDFQLKQEHKDNDNQEQDEIINSQYCLGISQFPNWNPQDAKTSIKVGLCLPETCTSSMLNEDQQLFETVERMMKYQFGSDLPYNKIKLRQIFCLPHETSEARRYSFSAILLFLFIATMATMCLIATIIDNSYGKIPENLKSNKRTWRTVLMESFSLKRNFEKLMAIKDDEKFDLINGEETFNRNTFFNVISGLKCIGLMWIIYAHTFLVGPITDRNLIATDKLTKTYFANIILTAHLMVDTFFTLSGLLASYLIFKDGIHKIKTNQWIIMTIHRYWRLTPIYLLCYWFTKSVGKTINSGPFWDYGTAANSPRLNCENESWWVAILHLSDFKSPKEHCIPFSWFIANGIKFWIVTPLFLILIYKSMRRGYAVTMTVILANMVLVYKLATSSSVDMKSVIEFRPESADNMLNNMGEIYTRPYSRIAPYLIGLLAGHLIYLIDTKQLQVNLSNNVKILIWSWFTLTTMVLTFILKIANGFKLNEEAIPLVFGIGSALHRPLWALCTCWLVFALAHGQAKWVAKLLSAKFWQIIAKLSFCAYLAQGEVIVNLFLARSNNDAIGYFDLFARPIMTTILTIAVSTLMVLVVEFPFIGIEELILPRRHKHSISSSMKPELEMQTNANGSSESKHLTTLNEKIKGS